jgi:hypothetical protein
MSWKVVAASTTGIGHVEKGEPCQDAHAWWNHNDWLVCVVCDGAGSASRGEIGAQFGADNVCRELSGNIHGAPTQSSADINLWKERVRDAIEITRIMLAREFCTTESCLEDFHATMVGAVIGPEYGLLFHIGDGAGVLYPASDSEAIKISPPENGDFANETFFYTETSWSERLRFTPMPHQASRLVLMSDGTMSFAMTQDRSGMDLGFFAPVDHYLQQTDAETGSLALANTLSDERTHQITRDDKTLLWASRL